MTYKRFLAMIATSTVVMFILMYSTAYRFTHVWWSQTRFWMALYMGAAMAVIMMGFMLSMYSDKQKNVAVFAGSAVLFMLALFLARSQETIGDVAWMKAMIPHHSIAILTSERAGISDPRVRRLADEIILAQRREIAEMEALIADLDGTSADGPALEPTVPPVDGGSENVTGAPNLEISDQAAVGGGVRAERVAVSSDAWIVVHRAADGGGPDISRIVGVSFVMHGTTESVPIHFDAAVSRGETLYAMLHHDTGRTGVFEFEAGGTADPPLTQAGRPVVEAFSVR
jgi:hypothetical protein